MFFNTKNLISVLTVASLSACASAPNAPQELVDARSAVSAMKAEPLVLQFEEEADRASSELEMAEQLFADRKDLRKVKHRAYLAQQYAVLVGSQAENLRVQEEVAKADDRRQSLLLLAREKNAKRAEAAADESRGRAEDALRMAEEERTKAREAIAEAAELSQALDELKAEQTERGLVLTLTDVLFDTGKSEVKPGAGRAMDKLAEYLEKSGSTAIVVEGHTDSRGTEELNRALSNNRAASVRKALLDRGVAADRVSFEGKGEAFPVASNETPAGRQQNRRVEIIVTSN